MNSNLSDLLDNVIVAALIDAQAEEDLAKVAAHKTELEKLRLASMSPDEKLQNLQRLGFTERVKMATGQGSTSVLLLPPATEPHNLAKMVEAGQYLPHPSGKFVRP